METATELSVDKLVKRITIAVSTKVTCIAYLGKEAGKRLDLLAEHDRQTFVVEVPSFASGCFNFMLTAAKYEPIYIELEADELHNHQVIPVVMERVKR